MKAAAARRVAWAEAAEQVAADPRLGGGEITDPTADVMLAAFRAKAWDVAVLRHLVNGLDVELDQPDPGGGALWMARSIAGPTGSTSKLHEAAPHVWVTMYERAQRDLIDFGAKIRAAGVEEERLAMDRAETARAAVFVRGVTEAALELVVGVLGECAPEAVEGVRARWVEGLPGIIRAQVQVLEQGNAP